MSKPLKVFISYSRKSVEYKAFVLELATRLLRDERFDVILDQWDLHVGHDTNFFMEDSIRCADKVLILCEKSYVDKANAREGGVGKETGIITPGVYGKAKQEKFIPVLLEGSRTVPDYLRGRLGVDFGISYTDNAFKELCNAIRGIAAAKKPQFPPDDEELSGNDDTFSSFSRRGHASEQKESPVLHTPQGLASPVKDFEYKVSHDGVMITKYKGKDSNVTIPPTIDGWPVTRIGNNAFDAYTDLTSVAIPGSVIRIGEQSFWGCKRLSTVTIPGSVISIGDEAFRFCSGLNTVSILRNVTIIGNLAFCGCSGLLTLSIPDSVTRIGDGAFWDCSGLISVTISKNVYSIGYRAFCGCSSLTFVSIPEQISSIEGGTFDGCTSLTSIAIPEGVTSIRGGAFWGCEKLKDVFFAGTRQEWNAIKVDYKNTALQNAVVHYGMRPNPNGSLVLN